MNPNPNFHMFQGVDDMLSLPDCGEAPSRTLIYNVSFLREKIHQLDSLAGLIISQEQPQQEFVGVTILDAESVAKEIITAASSAIDALHQIKLISTFPQNNLFTIDTHSVANPSSNPSNHTNYGVHESSAVNNTDRNQSDGTRGFEPKDNVASTSINVHNNIIVELDATAVLLQYTSYCHICGKGFKRDANLRMHMRAHGDEYRTSEALARPTNPCQSEEKPGLSQKYSCPHEGCRRNKGHPRFTPLKSVLCVKNHYKRCHFPKMYVCKKCNKKEFSILSDLRTHERICGLRWRCSCGTFFTRKDKLMGHVALFTGHQPLGQSSSSIT